MKRSHFKHPEFHRETTFRGQNIEEHVILFVRHHGLYVLTRASLPFFLIIGLPLVLVIMLFLSPDILNSGISIPERIFWGFGFLVYLMAGHRLFLLLIDHFFDVLILTNLRLLDIRRSVFLNDVYEGIDLHKIEDVKSDKKGLLQNMLQFGSVTVNIERSRQSHRFTNLYRPTHLVERINEYKRKYIRNRSGDKVSY